MLIEAPRFATTGLAALCAAACLSTAVQAQPVPAMRNGAGQPSLAPVISKVTDGVVNIAVRSESVMENPLMRDPFFRRFFDAPDRPLRRERVSAGSGVIVDAGKGYILTNHHVVDKATEIVVTLKDRRQIKATLVGSDPATDIAVLKTDARDLTAVPTGNSDQLEVGDYVLAIGNPFGLGQTVTSGIVSALRRSGLRIEGYEDFIQTDAPINPGNSGGALVNLQGQLVGVNTAIIGPSGGNVGIGFAVPVNMAMSVMNQIIEHGSVQRGILGVLIQDVTPDLAKALNLSAAQGAIISQVQPNTAAQRTGLRAGDVIVAVNGVDVADSSDLRNRIGLIRLGETVTIGYLRDGQRSEVKATIGRPGGGGEQRASTAAGNGATGEEVGRLSGARLGDSPDGVMVQEVEPGSVAARVGLQSGDRILSVNREPVKTAADLRKKMSGTEGVAALLVERDGDRVYVVVRG